MGRQHASYANEGQPKKQDFMATVSPAVEAWWRLPAVRIRGQGALDFVYFKDVSRSTAPLTRPTASGPSSCSVA